MWKTLIFFAIILELSFCYDKMFSKTVYQVGIEYDHSLPMKGGSNKYRHRNNYDPFYVTLSTTAKKGYVLDLLEVSTIVDVGGEVDFRMVQGDVGSTRMTFQLVTNNTDFLYYSYMAYGIKEADYRKMANHIVLPITNYSTVIHIQNYLFVSIFATFFLIKHYLS